jgi:quinol monooxygenase YgiN
MADVVSALSRAKGGCQARVAEILGELLAPSRAEPGCLLYPAAARVARARLVLTLD